TSNSSAVGVGSGGCSVGSAGSVGVTLRVGAGDGVSARVGAVVTGGNVTSLISRGPFSMTPSLVVQAASTHRNRPINATRFKQSTQPRSPFRRDCTGIRSICNCETRPGSVLLQLHKGLCRLDERRQGNRWRGSG